jgi:hypothetical protein
MPRVEDHVVDRTLIYPAAGMLVRAVEAANQMAAPRHRAVGLGLKDVRFMRALTVPRTADGVETVLHFGRTIDDAGGSTLTWAEFRLFSYVDDDTWQQNCRGFAKVDYETPPKRGG